MNLPNLGSVGTLAGILGLAFASGINLYLAVLTVGVSIHFGWVTGIPKELETLAHPAIIGLAAIMYVAEFVADKVPFFTPIWDAVHTVIRPVGGALLALQATAQLSPLAQAASALLAGSVALGAHSSKTGLRLLAHAAPEPTTHSALSIAEDVGVVSLLVLAYEYPQAALVVLAVLLVAIAFFAPMLLRVLRFLFGGIGGRLRAWFGSEPSPEDYPNWLRKEMQRLDVPAGPHIVRCFTRSGATVSRLRDGYIVQSGSRWWLIQKRLLGDNLKFLSEGGQEKVSLTKGLIYDVLRFSLGGEKPHSYYIAKDWSKAANQLVESLPPQAREVAPPPGEVFGAHS